MGVVSTPPLTPPASPERLMPTRDPSRPFLCGINGSTSAESFTSWAQREEESLRSHRSPADGTVAQLCHVMLGPYQATELCPVHAISRESWEQWLGLKSWGRMLHLSKCTLEQHIFIYLVGWQIHSLHWIQPLLKSKNQRKTQLDFFKY